MNKTKLAILIPALIAGSLTISACSGESQPAKEPVIKDSVQTTEPTAAKPQAVELPNQIQGQAFAIEQVRLSETTLEFRKGSEFFADMEFKVSLPDGWPKSNQKFVATGGSFESPWVSAGIKKKGSSFPDTNNIDSKYALELAFGQQKEFGIPVKINFNSNSQPTTSVSGNYFISFGDIKVDKTYQLDRNYDSFDTLKAVGKNWIKKKHPNLKIDDTFSSTVIGSDDIEWPKKGFVGFEAKIDNVSQVFRLQYKKDQNGWAVFRALKANQLAIAHPMAPISKQRQETKVEKEIEVIVAQMVEKQLNQEKITDKVRASNISCEVTKAFDQASCQLSYTIKDTDNKTCREQGWLLSKQNDQWKIDKKIAPKLKIDAKTSELKESRFTPSCDRIFG